MGKPRQVRELTLAQLDRLTLRSGDAVQLAAALVWVKQRPRWRAFVTNGVKLAAAAAAAGSDVRGV